jgi:predicted RNA-binding Zn ribbon-like protein
VLDELSLIEGFLNTVDHERGPDALSDAAGLQAWARGLGEPVGRTTRADAARARELREALRALLRSSRGEPVRGRLAAACSAYPLRAGDPGAGETPLVPIGDGPRRAVGRVAAAIAVARLGGTLDRVKLCPGDGCGWAFVDRSRNRSRRWCEMQSCGNQHKVRAYRDRHRAAARSVGRIRSAGL